MATTKSTVKTIKNPDVEAALAAVGVKIPGISSTLPPGKAKDDVYVAPKKTTTVLPVGKAKDDVYVAPARTVVRPTSTSRTKDDTYIAPVVRPTSTSRTKDDVATPANGSRTSDPLMNAINKWRATGQSTQPTMGPQAAPINPWKPPVQLIPVGKPLEVGLTSPRPATGYGGLEQSQPLDQTRYQATYTPPPARITDRAQDGLVQDRPTPIQQRIQAMGLTGEVPTTSYTDLAPVGQFFNNVWGAYNDSAAKERMDYTVEQNNRAFQERTDSSWGDVAAGYKSWIDAGVANNEVARRELDQWRAGEQTFSEGLGDYYEDMRFKEFLAPAQALGNIDRPTADFGRQAQNVLAGLQSSADMLYSYPYIGDTPPSAYVAAVGDKLIEASQGEGSQAPLNLQNLWTDFSAQVQKYRDAVTPTAEEAVRMSDADNAMNQQRAYLNTLGGVESVANAYDQLVNQGRYADDLWQSANDALLAGAQVEGEEREKFWVKAAADGTEAYRIENAHPVEIVNQNTNLVRQLLSELLLPDVTDVAAGVLSIAKLTPKARRLTQTVNEVMSDQTKVVERLSELAITPDNAVAVATERSDYKKFLDLWHTGRTKSDLAASRMIGPVVNLVNEVDTVSDIKVLMTVLAQTPQKIVQGIPANLFQTQRVIDRAASDGLVRFGSMGLDKSRDALRIYQQVAVDFLENAQSLKAGPILNPLDFVNEFVGYMRQGGYRYYNVGDDLSSVPVGTVNARIRSIEGGQSVVDYVDANKAVIGSSDPMAIRDARKQKEAVLIDVSRPAPQSIINKVGTFQRNLVTPLNLFTSPGTMLTNLLGGLTMAVGDNVLSTASRAAMTLRKNKLFGVDPTLRGLEGLESNLTMANQAMSWNILKPLKRLYGSIDERVGERVFDASITHALRTAGKPILQKTLTPILQQFGVTSGREIKKITNQLWEIGAEGGDMMGEFARIMTGNSRVFSLSDINPTWVSSVPPGKLEELHDIIRKAKTPEEAAAQVLVWKDGAMGYWDDMLASSQPTAARHSWLAQETVADAGDIAKDVKRAVKHGEVSQEEAQAIVAAAQEGLKRTEAGMKTLQELVTASGRPENRYVLYDVWQKAADITESVRFQLGEMAQDVYKVPPGADRKAAWRGWLQTQADLWAERHATVDKLLENGAQAVARGDVVAPDSSAWASMERTARRNEDELWKTMQMEPQSGEYDTRLQQVMDAGRAIADKAVARVYYAATQFPQVDAFDWIVSAERNVNNASSAVKSRLRVAYDEAVKAQNFDPFFATRNELWRKFREFEKDVWGIAERGIVGEGMGGGKIDDAIKALDDALPFDAEAQKVLAEPQNAQEALGGAIRGKTIKDTAPIAAPQPSLFGEAIGGLLEQVASLEEARRVMRDEWNRVAKGKLKLPKLDTLVFQYQRKGVVELPEMLAEDLYGKSFAGRTFNGQADVDAFVKEYADLKKQADKAIQSVEAQAVTLDDLAGIAQQAGIATASEAGRPINQWLTNAINKDRKAAGLQPVTWQALKSDPVLRDDVADLLMKRIGNADPTISAADYIPPVIKPTGKGTPLKAAKAIPASSQAKPIGLPDGDLYQSNGKWFYRGSDDTTFNPVSDEFAKQQLSRSGYDDGMRQVDMGFALFDPGKELDLSKNLVQSERTIKNTTAAGGLQTPDFAMGASYAKAQLDNIVDYVTANIGEIMTPYGRGIIGEGQGLRAIEEFKKTVMPAWDNVKTIAGQYGNKMRSFTMIDANGTRLDEIMSLWMPFGVWAVRSMKNSLERAIFEPHIWRRVMQAERDIRAIQDQRGDPERYEGGIPYDDGSGVIQYIQYLPSKLWQAAGLFTQNDYADPESANNAFSFGVESLRSANMNPYPWIEAAQKLYAGEGDDIYPMTFAAQGRIMAGLATKFMGADTPKWLFPGWLENATGRTLSNMAVDGDISMKEAGWADDLLHQIKNGSAPLPEQGNLDDEKMIGILDTAMKKAAGVDLKTAIISWLTGANVKEFDESEKVWTEAAQNYRDYQYGPTNPYGSNLASDSVEDVARLAWLKAAIWKDEEQRPGIMMATHEKKELKETINNDLNSAVAAWINSQEKNPKNAEINDFKLQWVQDKYGVTGEYFGDAINTVLEQTYPSATEYEGGQAEYKGYNPEEKQAKAKENAYYQATNELATYVPDWPGDDASRQEKAAYFKAREAYEEVFALRVEEIMSDPQAMSILAGRQMYTDFSGAPYDIGALQNMPMSEAFGTPARPTGTDGQMMTGLVPLAGEPQTAEELIKYMKTRNMSPEEIKARELNESRSGGYGGGGGRGGRRRRRDGGGRGYGGGGGGGGFRYGQEIDPRYMQGDLWPDADYIERWRASNPNLDWLQAGRQLAPGQPKEWRPISWKT
jgi:hypothetical protein